MCYCQKNQTRTWSICLLEYYWYKWSYSSLFPRNYLFVSERSHAVFGMGTYVSYINPLCPADMQQGRFNSLWDLLKNRAVIYSLGVPAVYTTPLQFNSCYHGMTPQHYITGATTTPATSKCKWDHHWSPYGLLWHCSFLTIALQNVKSHSDGQPANKNHTT